MDLGGFGNAMQMERKGLRGRMAVLLGAMPPGELFNAVLDSARERKTQNEVERAGESHYLKNKLCMTDVVEVNFKADGYRDALNREEKDLFSRPLAAYHDEASEKGWAPGLPRCGS